MVAKNSNAPAPVGFTKTPPTCCGTSTKSAAAADIDGRQGGTHRRTSFLDESFWFERHQSRHLLRAVSKGGGTDVLRAADSPGPVRCMTLTGLDIRQGESRGTP
jgi:hypothetical protein